jgi:hypothetical protein
MTYLELLNAKGQGTLEKGMLAPMKEPNLAKK